MNKLMTTTALVLTVAGGAAIGANHSMGAFTQYQMDPATDVFASDLIGARIYATETDVGDTAAEGAETEWDNLGEINDMILNRDGSVQVVILGVGGFLGLGERDVAIQMDQIKFVSDGEDADDYFLVINANQEAVENAPEFQRTDMNAMGDGSDGTEMTDETQNADTVTVEGDTMEAEAEEAEAEVENMAEETEQAAEEAASETEQAAEEAASETEQAAEEAAAETEQAAEEAGDAVENAAEEVEAEVEEETAN